MNSDSEEQSAESETSETPRIDRRTYLVGAGSAALAATAGCSSTTGGGGGNGPLNVMVWNDYTKVKDKLQNKIGRNINMTAMTSSTKMFSKWNSGGAGQFDMALPNNNLVQKFYKANLLQSVDTGSISNWGDTYSQFQNLATNQFKHNGKMFGVPVRFGWYGLSYDKSKIPKDKRNTTDTLWDTNYKGKIGVYDNHFKGISMAALELGFQDAFKGKKVTLSDKQLKQCKQKLIDQKPLLFGYLAGNPSWVKAYKRENVAVGWSGRNEIVQLKQDGVSRVDTTVANQGGLAWFEAAIVSKKSKNKDAVQKLIDALLSPEIGAKLAQAGGAPTVNPKIKQNLTKEQQNLFLVDPSRMTSLIPFKPMKNEKKWISTWEAVKNA